MKQFLLKSLFPQENYRVCIERYMRLHRLDIWNLLKIRRSAVKSDKLFKKKNCKNYLSVCAIAKDEGEYIKEWLDYHILFGVDKFYLYDNESTDNMAEVLKPYIDRGIVDYTVFPGQAVQMKAYEDCIQKHKNDTHWIALIDLDEFIVDTEPGDIKSFLKTIERFPALQLSWMIYGDSGHKKKTKGMVIEKFKSHALPQHETYPKLIINPRLFLYFVDCHIAVFVDKYAVNTRLEAADPFSAKMPCAINDKFRINHYTIKSFDEYMERRTTRPIAFDGVMVPREKVLENYAYWNRNEVKNDPIMDKYIQKLKEKTG
ncbi:MAG: glycosyltransferase family 92 protein [Proteobacteria bacterium]|nr:glycosyltransferase family 92 protein [Pseudomonadota bacterium]